MASKCSCLKVAYNLNFSEFLGQMKASKFLDYSCKIGNNCLFLICIDVLKHDAEPNSLSTMSIQLGMESFLDAVVKNHYKAHVKE